MFGLKEAQFPLNIYVRGSVLLEQHRANVVQVLFYLEVSVVKVCVLHLNVSLVLIRT